MRAIAIPDHNAVAHGMLVRQAVCGRTPVSGDIDRENTIAAIESGEYPDGPVAGAELLQAIDITRADAARLVGVLQQLEILVQRQSPRIAFKVKGRIFFLQIAEILAVQAKGNYVSLRHPSSLYVVRGSISSLAEKFHAYGFVRIHRSVLVNPSLVEEIQPLSTGEYKVRLRDGAEYTLTRTYKNNIRHLAHLWLGVEPLGS